MRGYPEEEGKGLGMVVRASTQNRLQERKVQLEKQLKLVNEAMELFSKHPEISDALDLLSLVDV